MALFSWLEHVHGVICGLLSDSYQGFSLFLKGGGGGGGVKYRQFLGMTSCLKTNSHSIWCLSACFPKAPCLLFQTKIKIGSIGISSKILSGFLGKSCCDLKYHLKCLSFYTFWRN